MTETALSDTILDLAAETGIDAIGIAKADPFSNYALKGTLRHDPRLSLSTANSIIVAGIYIGGFALPAWEDARVGRTSRLLLSGFFLDVVEPLESIRTFIEGEGFSAVVCDGFREGGSVLPLKLTAVRGGLGWQGKHTLVISPTYGTYLAWGVNSSGWWGEGELKFFLDGDERWPTICGTGTEDYFGGAWNFEHPPGEYGIYSTPFLGLPQVIKPDGLYRSQQRFGMYRWHIPDPIRFRDSLRVTIQALGWRSMLEDQRRYLPLQDDIASTAFWYQTEPHHPFLLLGSLNDLEVI